MKVLVVGGGGREHAIVRALARSERSPELICTPGNAGIAPDARLLDTAGDLLRAEIQHGERQADLVVAIALGAQGGEAPSQDPGDGLLGGGLRNAARDAHHDR